MTETTIIGGVDYGDTDPEARAIMDHLAKQGVTEQKVARTSYRELVNMILKAQRAVESEGGDGQHDPGEDVAHLRNIPRRGRA